MAKQSRDAPSQVKCLLCPRMPLQLCVTWVMRKFEPRQSSYIMRPTSDWHDIDITFHRFSSQSVRACSEGVLSPDGRQRPDLLIGMYIKYQMARVVNSYLGRLCQVELTTAQIVKRSPANRLRAPQ